MIGARWVRNKLRNYIANLVRAEVQKAIVDVVWLIPQLVEFHNSPKEDRQSYRDHNKDSFGNRHLYEGLKDRILAISIPVQEVDIDISDFEHWLDSFPEIRDFYHNMGEYRVEKCLEHYLAFRHLRISADDVYIDIAAAGSPWAEVLNKRGIKCYRLDLVYPEGIHNINIGADAGVTKLPDSFATVLSAQCAYECFMGDADILFVREATRILTKNGRYGIVPLYLDDTYFVTTSPYCRQQDVVIDSEAKRVWRDDEFKVPFSRHYSPESFKKRVYSNVPSSMTGKLLYFRNLPDVMKHYRGQRIYCFFMFYCEKQPAVPHSTGGNQLRNRGRAPSTSAK